MPKQAADPLAIVKKRRIPAVVVLDMDLNVVLLNGPAEARVALTSGEAAVSSDEMLRDPLLASVDRLAKTLLEANVADASVVHWVDVHLDGDSVYGLSADFLAPVGSAGAGRMVMVNIDAVCLKREVDFDAVRRRYGVSRREQDVLRMLYYGKGNREIAELLFISEYTVKDHIKAIMAKMEAGNRAEVVYKLTTTA